MASPRLIHPVPVVVQPLDRGSSSWDSSAREPIPQLRRGTSVNIDAQVHWGKRDVRIQTSDGLVTEADGYLALRRRDIEAAGWTPGHGDRVVSIDGVVQEVYLLGPGQHRGQYRRRSGSRHQLVRIFFKDRAQRHD